MTTEDAQQVLALAEQALPDSDDAFGPATSGDAASHPAVSDEVSDMLLATVFGPDRSWEIACEMVDDTLDRLRVCTLVRFLR